MICLEYLTTCAVLSCLYQVVKLFFKKSFIFAIYRGIKVHCIVQSLVFSVAFCRSLLFRFPFLFWPLYILFVLRFSALGYPFGILKLYDELNLNEA
jgi:FlaA1/EpsC-like NDP-sugar epimerase